MKTNTLIVISLLFCSCTTKPSHEKDLVAYWSFDDTIHGSANESSGTLLKTINRGAKIVNGYKGKALEFDGLSVLEVSYNPKLNSFQNGITVSAWIKKDSSSHWNTVISREIDSTWSEYIGLAVFKNHALFSVDPDGKRYINTTDSNLVDTDRWVHIAGTYDNETLKLYLNGKFISAMKCMGPLNFHDKNPLLIGGNSNDRNRSLVDCFKGAIDELMIYSRAMNAEEIRIISKK